MPSEQIAVVGAGAVGCYFGGMLARAGLPVVFLRRPKPGAASSAPTTAPLHIDSIHFQQSIPVQWATDPSALRDADVVLFCVKALDNESASQQIAPHLKTGAIVVSLQNGVDNAERIRAASAIDALPSVVYVAASMPAPDRVKHVGRGDLIIGELGREFSKAAGRAGAPLLPVSGKRGTVEATPRAQQVASLFEKAGVKCVLSANIEADLWIKLMINSAANAISALAHATYGRVAAHQPSRALIAAVVSECLAVARAAGVALPPNDFSAVALQTVTNLRDATSSTAQDLARGRRTEIDSLNGYVARLGAQLSIPTPVNSTLHALVKLLEDAPLPK